MRRDVVSGRSSRSGRQSPTRFGCPIHQGREQKNGGCRLLTRQGHSQRYDDSQIVDAAETKSITAESSLGKSTQRSVLCISSAISTGCGTATPVASSTTVLNLAGWAVAITAAGPSSDFIPRITWTPTAVWGSKNSF